MNPGPGDQGMPDSDFLHNIPHTFEFIHNATDPVSFVATTSSVAEVVNVRKKDIFGSTKRKKVVATKRIPQPSSSQISISKELEELELSTLIPMLIVLIPDAPITPLELSSI
ncbi:hypothetical protein LOD99_7167 [Oopsacas minuta]|uniref:Uncharacterized protein n=1 Tax=Oopsacas minuta TaxID=111878 RepID=A0AAV7JIS6_9METZ|nr:hypothetical protein LOD99_7167 [Oopsacas minuta]